MLALMCLSDELGRGVRKSFKAEPELWTIEAVTRTPVWGSTPRAGVLLSLVRPSARKTLPLTRTPTSKNLFLRSGYYAHQEYWWSTRGEQAHAMLGKRVSDSKPEPSGDG